jgi:prepilin-type N-terminal cleavage/methylation domain-containing protein
MLRVSTDAEGKKCAKKTEAGFTLVEMMIVVAIIAMLSALAIPRVSRSLEQSRAVATQEDLRSVGTSFASYLLITGKSLDYTEATLSPSDYQPVSAVELRELLDAEIPEHDHFNNLIDYRVDVWPEPNLLLARSAGSDRTFEPIYQVKDLPTTVPCNGFFGDIVWVNGRWIAKLRNPPCWPKD